MGNNTITNTGRSKQIFNFKNSTMDTKKLPTEITIECTRNPIRVKIDGKEITPARSLVFCNHSPDGFNWGYGGSGPSQLALAILLEFMEPEEALKFYQHFKWNTVATWRKENLTAVIELHHLIMQIKEMVCDWRRQGIRITNVQNLYKC